SPNFLGPNPPPHTFSSVGQYTISLILKDIYNCADTFTKVKYINIDTPSASFTMSSAFASCPPLIDNFTFTGHYAKSVLWDFGGPGHPNEGVSSSLPTTSHLYAFPGTYYPTLTVTSPGGCTAKTNDTVTILGPGLQTFAYTPVGGCDSLTVHFSVTSTGPSVISYVWYFRDANSDSAITNHPDTSFTYTAAGYFIPGVRLIDSSNCGVPYSGTQPIIIDSIKAKFISDKQLLCSNGTVQFNNRSDTTQGTVISNFFWDFGDGNTQSGATDSVPSHFYAAPGLYTVTMTVTTQFGCSDVASSVIKVVASPNIGINGVVSQCVPATLTFSGVEIVMDTSALTWSWDFDNGQTSTLQNPPPQIYNLAGHYVIKLTATNSSNCSTIDSSDLFIYPLPNVYAGADTTICLGTSAQLQATGAVIYTWLPPSTSSLNCTTCSNPVATPTITTTYIVNGISPNGCQANDTVVVNVNQPVTVTVGPPDSVCLGQSTQLTASGAFFYAWTPAAGLSNPNIANPVATPTTTTNYQVVGSDSKYCFNDTGSQQVTVFNYPTLNIGTDQTILVGSSYQINGIGSPDIVSLNWLPVTGLSCTNCLSPLATPQQTTTYVLSATNNGNCTTTDSIKITVICNNNNFFVPNTFSPNGDGVNDVFYIQGKGINIIPSITIFNRWGQIVFQKKDFAPNNPSEGWDGTFNGKKAPVDVYVYTIDIICDNSTLIPYHGNVTLIR
ncbi:MAG TPA: PKD domain-containing protein, partial [Puia sp.]|nr:PKD domain-containing protein [Puia sp.]